MDISLEMFLNIGMLGAVLVAITHLLAGKAKLFLLSNTVAQAFVLAQGFMDNSMYVVVICIMIMSINVGAYIKELRHG
ncbi:MAG: hypothetical protein ACRC91_21760 [Aeromonas sp.]